jgi:hypothetical protein
MDITVTFSIKPELIESFLRYSRGEDFTNEVKEDEMKNDEKEDEVKEDEVKEEEEEEKNDLGNIVESIISNKKCDKKCGVSEMRKFLSETVNKSLPGNYSKDKKMSDNDKESFLKQLLLSIIVNEKFNSFIEKETDKTKEVLLGHLVKKCGVYIILDRQSEYYKILRRAFGLEKMSSEKKGNEKMSTEKEDGKEGKMQVRDVMGYVSKGFEIYNKFSRNEDASSDFLGLYSDIMTKASCQQKRKNDSDDSDEKDGTLEMKKFLSEAVDKAFNIPLETTQSSKELADFVLNRLLSFIISNKKFNSFIAEESDDNRFLLFDCLIEQSRKYSTLFKNFNYYEYYKNLRQIFHLEEDQNTAHIESLLSSSTSSAPASSSTSSSTSSSAASSTSSSTSSTLTLNGMPPYDE